MNWISKILWVISIFRVLILVSINSFIKATGKIFVWLDVPGIDDSQTFELLYSQFSDRGSILIVLDAAIFCPK